MRDGEERQKKKERREKLSVTKAAAFSSAKSTSEILYLLMVRDVQQILLHFQHWLSICCSEDSLLCEHRDKSAITVITSQWIIRTAQFFFPHHSFSWLKKWWMGEDKEVGTTLSIDFILLNVCNPDTILTVKPWNPPLPRPISFSTYNTTYNTYTSIDA